MNNPDYKSLGCHQIHPDDRKRILALYDQGLTPAVIARRFGLHRSTIWHVIRKEKKDVVAKRGRPIGS